ncbi:MAG: hypothetical protein QM477_07940 [Planctomycetota bacterium]
MKILTSLAILAFAGSLSAQTTILSEDFNAGIVPPAGWANVNNNGLPTIGWQADGLGNAWHDDEFIADSDNTLMTPVMDLSGLTNAYLHFNSQTHYTMWMANHPNSIGDGISTMEITTDGGLTWTQVWIDVATVDDVLISVDVDLSAWAGMANVQLGAHLYGTYDQDWLVDNIVVDDQPGGGGGGGLTYAITNLVAGQVAVFSVTGASAGGSVIIGYSLTGAGPTSTVYGMVDMSAPINTLATITASGAGDASFSPTVPGSAAGLTLYTQCLDLASGGLSNSLAELVL